MEMICPICGSDDLMQCFKFLPSVTCNACKTTWSERKRCTLTLTRTQVEEKLAEAKVHADKEWERGMAINRGHFFGEQAVWSFLLGQFPCPNA